MFDDLPDTIVVPTLHMMTVLIQLDLLRETLFAALSADENTESVFVYDAELDKQKINSVLETAGIVSRKAWSHLSEHKK